MKIRYICHAGQSTGYGRAATNFAKALLRAGVDLEIEPINERLSTFIEGDAAELGKHVRSIASEYVDATIVHTTPLDCPQVYTNCSESGEVGAGQWIAYTTWEGVTAPRAVEDALFGPVCYGGFADVWVPSSSTQDAFMDTAAWISRTGAIHKYVMPHTYDPRVANRSPKIEKEVGTGTYRFAYVGAWNTRKNVTGLLRAYCAEFGHDDPVELVVHSPGVSVETFSAAMVATGLEQEEMPRVRLSTERLSDDAMLAFYGNIDCFVTATRGESWNLPAFEAMLAGRMIVAPGGMGHDDFLFEDPGDPAPPWDQDLTSAHRVAVIRQPAFVDVEMVQPVTVGEQRGFQFKTTGAQGLTCRTDWRDPELSSLRPHMRAAYESKAPLEVYYDPAKRFGYEAIAKRAIARIEWLLHQRKG